MFLKCNFYFNNRVCVFLYQLPAKLPNYVPYMLAKIQNQSVLSPGPWQHPHALVINLLINMLFQIIKQQNRISSHIHHLGPRIRRASSSQLLGFTGAQHLHRPSSAPLASSQVFDEKD